MSVEQCLIGKRDEGKLSEEQREKLQRQYDKMVEENRRLGLPEDVIKRRLEEAISQKEAIKLMTKNRKIQHLRAVKRMKHIQSEWVAVARKNKYRNTKIVKEFHNSILDLDQTDIAKHSDFSNHASLVDMEFSQELIPLLDRAIREAKQAGITDVKTILDIQSDLTKPTQHQAIKDFLQAVQKKRLDIAYRMRARGAEIFPQDDYSPQNWNRDAIIDRQDEFLNDLIASFDRAKMVDRETGTMLSDEDLLGLSTFMKDSIVTQGRNQLQVGTFMGQGRSLARKHAKPKHIQLTPEGWAYMMSKYGYFNTDAQGGLAVFFDSVKSSARDLAMMEYFGPNPKATIKHMGDIFQKTLDPENADFAKWVQNETDTTAAVLYGETSVQPTGFFQRQYARFAQANRKLWRTLVAFQGIQDVTSRPFHQWAKTVQNDLSSRDFIEGFRFMRDHQHRPEVREAFADLGIVTEAVAENHHNVIRWMGPDAVTGKQKVLSVMAWLPDWNSKLTERLSGAEAAASRFRAVDFMIPMVGLGRLLSKGKTLKDLPDGVQRIILKHMNEADWNKLVGMDLLEYERKVFGKSYLATNRKVYEHMLKTTGDEAEAHRMRMAFQGIVNEMADGTQPGMSLGTQYQVFSRLGGHKDWWWREFIQKESMMFLSWGLNHYFRTQRRLWISKGMNAKTKAAHTALLLSGGIVSGTVYQTMLDILSGRETFFLDGDGWDTEQQNDWLLRQVLLEKSGLLPIFGDLLAKTAGAGVMTGYGGFESAVGSTLIGAGRGMTLDVGLSLANEVVGSALDEERDFSAGKAVQKVTQPLTPQHLFYTRIAWERLILDGMTELFGDDEYLEKKTENAERYGRPYREGFEPGALYE